MRLIDRFVNRLRRRTSDVFESRYYGEVPYPWYDRTREISPEIPSIYNSAGEKMDVFFIRDREFASDPYDLANEPTHWLWDRYNFGLKTHFYSHWEMLNTIGRPDRRYGLLLESEPLCPETYRLFDTNPGLNKDFDLIFTSSERLLDKLDNARFFPYFANPRYPTPKGGGSWDDAVYQRKCRMTSILSSDKTMCPLHLYRIDLARRCRRENLADAFGTFDGGSFVPVADTLKDYRYSIVVENDISKYWFTVKLTDCFASMTVPIYYGAPAIGEFFNLDGMILLKPGEDIKKVLSQCSEKDYLERLPAIKDNYQRVQAFRNSWDWLWEKYLKERK